MRKPSRSSFLAESGDLDGSFFEAEKLLNRRINAQGLDHPDTVQLMRVVEEMRRIRQAHDAPATDQKDKADEQKKKRVRKQGRSGNPAKRAAEERDRKK